MDLLKTLKHQHAEMRQIAEKMRSFDITKAQKAELFAKIRDIMSAHRILEDTKLYPLLIEHAKENTLLKNKLNTFASDWQDVSELSLDYFKKYSDSPEGEEYDKDTGRFFASLKARTMKEEIGLFPEYEKIAKVK